MEEDEPGVGEKEKRCQGRGGEEERQRTGGEEAQVTYCNTNVHQGILALLKCLINFICNKISVQP